MGLYVPGTQLGRFKIGKDTVTIDYNGNSRILKSKLLKDPKLGEYILTSLDIHDR